MQATNGAYTIQQALWELPCEQFIWSIVSYMKFNGEAVHSKREKSDIMDNLDLAKDHWSKNNGKK